MFGGDLFESKEIFLHIRDLLGKGAHKPFECVGSVEESRVALVMSIAKVQAERQLEPSNLKELEKLLSDQERRVCGNSNLLRDWGQRNSLPKKFEEVLKKQLDELSY